MPEVRVPSGLVPVDKPGGITSHDVVDRVRRALGTRKVGHAGTLDPMATGLLLVGVGRATRLLRFLSDLDKTYEGTGRLGIETTTLDGEGEVVREAPVAVEEGALRAAMDGFTGELDQVPPAYSAVQVGGRRLYQAARKGEKLEAPPRHVRVASFELVDVQGERFRFRVVCSSGTYVRSLVAGVGTALGCGAHLAQLRRTEIGPFRVGDAVAPERAADGMLPVEAAVGHLRSITLHPEEARVAATGCCLGPAGLSGPYRALAPDGRLIGIYRDEGPKAVPEVILAPA